MVRASSRMWLAPSALAAGALCSGAAQAQGALAQECQRLKDWSDRSELQLATLTSEWNALSDIINTDPAVVAEYATYSADQLRPLAEAQRVTLSQRTNELTQAEGTPLEPEARRQVTVAQAWYDFLREISMVRAAPDGVFDPANNSLTRRIASARARMAELSPQMNVAQAQARSDRESLATCNARLVAQGGVPPTQAGAGAGGFVGMIIDDALAPSAAGAATAPGGGSRVPIRNARVTNSQDAQQFVNAFGGVSQPSAAPPALPANAITDQMIPDADDLPIFGEYEVFENAADTGGERMANIPRYSGQFGWTVVDMSRDIMSPDGNSSSVEWRNSRLEAIHWRINATILNNGDEIRWSDGTIWRRWRR